MTQDEIIEMAKQVGMIKDGEWWFSSFYKTEQDVHISHLEDFANLVAQHEREECKKLCAWKTGNKFVDEAVAVCYRAIDLRGQA